MTYVTQGPWGVGFTQALDGSDEAQLRVYRFPLGHNGPIVRGDQDGKLFPTLEEARKFAFERGYLKEHVYPWCPHCRVRHTFHGSRSDFCEATNTFIGRQ